MSTTNFERGDTAARALAAIDYPPIEDTIGEMIPTPDGELREAKGGWSVGDLIADLCHLMRRHDLDVDDVIERGVTHFAADVIEQAWEHDDGWADCLQDGDNHERAMAVMASAGVPERVREDALRYVGILPPLPPEDR